MNLCTMFVRKVSVCCIFMVLIVGVAMEYCSYEEKDLIFRLYTRDSRVNYYPLENGGSLKGFDSKKPTRIFIHGFKSKEKVIHRYKDAYLDLGDYNFIAVDWTVGASTYNYYSAKCLVASVSLMENRSL